MNQAERIERLIRVAQAVFGSGADTLGPDDPIRNIRGWESIRHLNFIMALEDALACALDPDDIEHMQTVAQAASAAGRARGDAN